MSLSDVGLNLRFVALIPFFLVGCLHMYLGVFCRVSVKGYT